ncbi:MAG: PLP-dependent aminotransferase family protein [Sarcina sp.]
MFSSLKLKNDEAIYTQIEKHIKDMIIKGLMPTGSKLPSTRDLSNRIKVSRNSVILAYENLEAEGVVYTLKGKGTFVSEGIKNSEENKSSWNIIWENEVNEYGKRAEALDIVKTEVPWKKGVISFKSIAPHGELFDMDELKKAFLDRISIEEDKILNYGYANGYRPLINYIKKYMELKGVDLSEKEVLITNGFTEGLEIVLDTFTEEGDKIICENPTHNTAIKLMKVHGLDIIGVKMDEEGIDLNSLEKNLEKEKVKFAYITPSYHNPTGIVMRPEKRYELYNLLKKYNVPLIEDGFNEELLYESSHISPIAALDGKNNGVIYIGSFSKILFPGMRIGWIIADRRLIDILTSVKRCKNIHTSFLDQGILYEYLNKGALDKHMKKVRKHYKDKYEFTLQCIEKYIDYKKVYGEGGFHLLIELEDINTRELLEKCEEKNVIFMPGDIFYVDDTGKNTMRLGFSRLNFSEIEEGIKIIGEVIKTLKGN